MSGQRRELWIHPTAGQGPAECAWAVVKVLEQMQKEASAASLEFKTCPRKPSEFVAALTSVQLRPA